MAKTKEVVETKEAVETQETSEVSTNAVETTAESEKKEEAVGQAEVSETPSDSNEDEDTDEQEESPEESGTITEDESLSSKDEESEAAEAESTKEDKAKTVVKEGKKVVQYKPECAGAITKHFKFEVNQGRSFDLDKKGFVKVVCYKRLRIRFWVSDPNYEFDYDQVSKHVSDLAYKVISGMRVEDIDINVMKPKNTYILDRVYNVVDVLVPYMRATGKVVSAYKSLVNQLNSETKSIQYKLKVESAAMILVDTTKEIQNTVSLKGFAALSFMDNRRGDDDDREPKVFYKGTLFVDKDCGFEMKDIVNDNDALIKNRIKIYSVEDSEKYSKLKYILPFRNKFSIVTYQLVDVTENGKFKVVRTLNRIRVRNIKVTNDVIVPIGVYLTFRQDTICVKKFAKFFVDTEYTEKKNANALEVYCDLNVPTIDMGLFQKDCESIDAIILDQLVPSNEEETETAEEQK